MSTESLTIGLSLPIALTLLLVASAVAILTRNIVRIPYTVALVLVGLIIGFTHLVKTFHLSEELILIVFLPPLLFEGALNMDLDILRRNAWGVLLLAVVGTFLSTFFLGVFSHYILGLGWIVAFLLGAILSPTDPVSVLALFKEEGVGKSLSVVVEGESVFNDGLGVVLYLILLQGAMGESISAGHATRMFLWEVLIGTGLGLMLGYLCHRLLGKIDDYLVEVMLSILLAFGCYVAADQLHASGVIAVVVAGLIMGNYGQVFSMSPGTRLALTHFWEVVAFVINSLLFLLIGIDLESFNLLRHAASIVGIFVLMTLIRFILVWGFASILSLAKKPWLPSWRPVIAWGGLKGSIPIALALGLPQEFPDRQYMVSVIFGVVLLSLVGQGLTFKSLLRKLGIGEPTPEEIESEELLGRLLKTNASIRALEEAQLKGSIPSAFYSEKIYELKQYRDELDRSLEILFGTYPELKTYYVKKLDRDLLRSRLSALADGLRRGILREETVEKLGEELREALLELECFEYKADGSSGEK
jgi:CPA1 family monovalent cation:H+ antiporter